MAKSFKKKQKLPKFGGGSMYDEQGQQVYGQNTQKMAGYGQMAGNFGTAMGANEDQFGGDFRSQNDQQEGAVMGAVGKIGPVGQVIQGAYQVGQGIGTKIRARAEATDETGHLKDEKSARRNAVIGGLFDPFKAFKTRSSYAGGFSDLSGKGYTKHLESEAQKRIAEENAPMLAEQQVETQRKLQYGTYAQGGRIYDSGNGIPNAEIEKQEVTGYTQGGIEAHDLNTHENATADNQISLQRGDMILSDKIKDPLNKNKTFAKVGKPYDTAREEKILNNTKATNLSKKTAELNFMSKKTLFQQTFERQEQLKADKVRKYANKLGFNLGAPQQSNLGITPEFAYGGGFQDDPKKIKASGYNATLVDPNKLPSDYKFMERTTTPLGGGRTKVTNLYNKPVTTNAIPGGTPDDNWEKSIINRLQSGESPEDLRDKGFFGDTGVEKYKKYYRPLKTEITQEAPKQDARVYGEKTIAGKLQPKGYAEQPWDTYITNPEAGKANVQTTGHYYQGRPIDPLRSFDSTGKIFTPAYLDEGASTGTYLQQQGNEMNRNPLPILPGTNTTNMMSTSVNRYGGIQKFAPGGRMYDWDMPVGGPLDKAILRDKNQSYKSDKTDYNYDPTAPTKSIYDQESDPNGGSANWDDMNSPEFKKENQEMLARAQDAARSEQGKSNNWKEGVYQGVTGLASNMGELFAMYKASKPVEVQQRYDYKPEVLNNTAADRAAWKMYKNTAENLKNAGLSGGQYASNLGANRASLTEQLDTQRINRENINTGIRNDAQVRNIAGRYSVDAINAHNRAVKEKLQLKATERMGTNIAQQSKDYRATQQEKDMLPFMQKAFSDPAFQKMFAEWMATQGKKSK